MIRFGAFAGDAHSDAPANVTDTSTRRPALKTQEPHIRRDRGRRTDPPHFPYMRDIFAPAPGGATPWAKPQARAYRIASTRICTGCLAARPVPCKICCRQETPGATISASGETAARAGNSRSPPMAIERS